MKFVQHVSPAHFLDTAGSWLLEAEAEHNLVLGLAMSRADSANPPDPRELFATIQEGERVVGCLFRTPPLGLGLTRMPDSAIPLAARQVAALYGNLPGVLGPPDTARAFAGVWSGMTGASVRPGLQMEIHALQKLIPPPDPAPGRMRLASEDDGALVGDWGRRFVEEAGIDGTGSGNPARTLLKQGSLYLWEDGGEVVSMAGALGPTPRGIRIGYVFTPPRARGRGYATALVAGLTGHLLAGGRDLCFLYTDRANPVSSGIYRRLGYRPVALASEIAFGDPPG
jgi:GNAT superfamily N-acetyltransferase